MSLDDWPRVVCPCWPHRLQWWLVRQSVRAAFAGHRYRARVLLTLSEVVV